MLSLFRRIFKEKDVDGTRVLSEREGENQAMEFLTQEMAREDLSHEEISAYLEEAMAITSSKLGRVMGDISQTAKFSRKRVDSAREFIRKYK